jgi:hypothetical protein
MKKPTKRNLMVLLPLAVVAGFILTLLFTGQENFKQLNSSCANSYFNAPQVKTVNCSTLDQGYPFRFLRSAPDVTSQNGDILDISSSPKVDTYRLIADVAVWSIVSLIVLSVFAPTNTKKSKK